MEKLGNTHNNDSEPRKAIDWHQVDLKNKMTPMWLEEAKEEMQKEHRSDEEILNSSSAKSVLPFLTFKELSNHEKAEILRLASCAIRKIENDDEKLRKYEWVDAFGLRRYERFFGNEIAYAVGEGENWNNKTMTSKIQEARKLFASSMIDARNKARRNKDSKEHALLSGCFLYDCGGLGDYLELLSIARREPDAVDGEHFIQYNDISHTIIGHILDMNAEQSDFDGLLKNTTPIKQLQLLSNYLDILGWDWHRSVYWGWGINHDKIFDAVSNLKYLSGTAPLNKLISENIYYINAGKIHGFYLSNDENESNEANESKRKMRSRLFERQIQLREEYPGIPRGSYATVIAPGVVGVLSGEQNIGMITNKAGQAISLFGTDKNNTFGIDQEAAQLISAAHNPIIKSLIDKNLGLNLAEIPLDAQIPLLKYMTEADNDRFYRLRDTLQNTDKGLRLKLAKSFLAADFGEDFGDGLLDIANSERISSEQLSEILDNVESCRESIHGITDLYKDYDDKFAKSYTRAANERLTDAIATFRQIAKTGEAKADLDWAGETKFNFNEAMEALKYETESLKIIDGTLEDIKNGKKGTYAERVLTPESYSGFSYYNLYSPDYGYVLLYTRAEGSGSFDERMEYGKQRSKYSNDNSAGVEASISLITNPIDPFAKDERFGLPNLFKPDQVKAAKNPNYYDSRMNKVSAIRIDREGRAPGMAANDPLRNPMNKIGMISVDLAAINDRQDTPSGKIARLISTGNKLRSETSGTDFNLNHNTRWFDQEKYGTSDGFAVLVKYVDSLVMTWCNNTRPDKNTPSYRKLMRGGGRKAAVVAQNDNKQQTA